MSGSPDACVHLTPGIVLEVHREAITRFGGSEGVLDMALLESAVAAPQATTGGESPFADLIEIAAAFVGERVRRVTPRAALLSTLAGIALGFISLGFLFRTFARPVVGLTTMGIVMLTYFGRVRFKGRVPGGMVAVALGTLLSWIIGIAPVGEIGRAHV